MDWIIIDEDYLDYLRSKESRIPFSDYGKEKFKPFFGILFEENNLYYVTQISHPQSRHERLKENIDFKKLYNPKNTSSLMAVVNLNYMFPVPKEYFDYLDLGNIEKHRKFNNEREKSKYIDLLNSELKEINKKGIAEDGRKLYELKNNYPEHSISKRCLDYKDLEKVALLYNKKKTTTKSRLR